MNLKLCWFSDLHVDISIYDYSGLRRRARVITCKRFGRQKGGHGPRRSLRGPRKLRMRVRQPVLSARKNIIYRICALCIVDRFALSEILIWRQKGVADVQHGNSLVGHPVSSGTIIVVLF